MGRAIVMPVRQPDAELKLLAFAQAEAGRPFIWGDTNCVALGLRSLDAVYASGLHDRYGKFMATPERAAIWVRKNGLQGLLDKFEMHGFALVHPAYSQPGDVLLAESDGTITAAIDLGRLCLSSRAGFGVQYHPRQTLTPATVAVGVR